MSMADDYIDLLASGDEQKIKCVLMAAAGGALIGGYGSGVAFAPANVIPGAGTAFNAVAAGIGAVVGAFGSAKVGYRMCGGEATNKSFEKIFTTTGDVSLNAVRDFESYAMINFSVSAEDARKLAKVSQVYFRSALSSSISASYNEQKNSVEMLLKKLNEQGVV